MQQAYSHITAAAVLLDDPAEAPQRIDRALARCIAEKRPDRDPGRYGRPSLRRARAFRGASAAAGPTRMHSPRRLMRPRDCF